MTTVHAGINAPPGTAFPEGDWADLSALLTEEAEILTPRRDVAVVIAPGAAGHTCALFDRARAVIEIDGDKLDGDPASYLPRKTAKKSKWNRGLPYATREKMEGVYGLLVHEASHATHSLWMDEAAEYCQAQVRSHAWTEKYASRVIDAAVMLEEVRVEAAAVRKTWWTRRWQRLAACQHLLGNISAGEQNSRLVAATVATLIGGRVQHRILDPEETADLRLGALATLGDTYDGLVYLTDSAVTTDDTDHMQMLALGEQWCDLVYRGDEEDPDAEAAEALMKLAQALGEIIDRDGGLAIWTPDPLYGYEPGWRDATGREKAAANALTRRLLPYFLPERSATRIDRVTPPGRLRGSVALRAAAQDALGLPQTAEPWRFTDRKIIPVPPLRAGLVLDVSGSMQPLAPVSQGIGYRFGAALARLPDALFRGAVCGYKSAPLAVRPGQVAMYKYGHGEQNLHDGLDDLTGRLDLMRRDAARLVIIVSDCYLTRDYEVKGVTQHVQQLTAAGVRILWVDLVPDYSGFSPADIAAHEARYGLTKRIIQGTPGVTWVTLTPQPHEDWVTTAVSQAEDALVQVMTNT